MLNDRELATVLAALRYYQNDMHADGAEFAHGDISTNCGTLNPLTADEIDALCERLNFTAGDAAQSGFIRTIANMSDYDWSDDDSWSDDQAEDALTTLNRLMDEARKLVVGAAA